MTTIFMTVMQMLPATAYVKMIDVFLIAGQLYPFLEVVLLTLMEFTREGDGSGHMDEVDDLPDVKFLAAVNNFVGDRDTPVTPSRLSLDPIKAKKMSSVKKIYYYQLIGKKYYLDLSSIHVFCSEDRVLPFIMVCFFVGYISLSLSFYFSDY